MVETESRICIHVNDQFREMFRIPADVMLIGTDCVGLAEQTKNIFRDPTYFIDRIDRLMAERKKVVADLVYLSDGRCLERDFIPVFSDKEYAGHLWVYRDITTIHMHAVTDDMTGLYNRRGLELFAGQYLRIARRDMKRVSLIFADIDGLKKINDKYGHEAGDEMICDAAKAIAFCFRDSDIVCRLGGDEFVAMTIGDLPERLIRSRLTYELMKCNEARATPYELSISFGIHEWTGEDLTALIKAADAKMYKAKF